MVCHASRAFALGPSLGLDFSTLWEEGKMEQWKQVINAHCIVTLGERYTVPVNL